MMAAAIETSTQETEMHTYEMTDRHANARDKKRDKRVAERLMRGNRSVFTMAEAQRKRDGKSLRDYRRS